MVIFVLICDAMFVALQCFFCVFCVLATFTCCIFQPLHHISFCFFLPTVALAVIDFIGKAVIDFIGSTVIDFIGSTVIEFIAGQ